VFKQRKVERRNSGKSYLLKLSGGDDAGVVNAGFTAE
jgi:hypothetical protein